jgi:hypothetical protein
MKVLGRWPTVGFALLALVLGVVSGVVAILIMMPATRAVRSDATTLAVFLLVSTAVLVYTLMLASRRTVQRARLPWARYSAPAAY